MISNETIERINKGLAIALVWDIDDVMGLDDDLTEDQAKEVLRRTDDCHDCNYGLTWEHLEAHIKDILGGK